MTDYHLPTEKQAYYGTEEESTRGGRARVTIDMIPDVALLTIFDFYIRRDEWYTLVHVCHKWRSVVFGSPRRLNLRLYFTPSTPVRETIDVWPPSLPIVIWTLDDSGSVYNIIAALEHNHRICIIDLVNFSDLELEEISAAMQRPFPALTRLRLDANNRAQPDIPASFLGGFAPSLRELYLSCISFPTLPKLLLSATRLVRLDLRFIPDYGYISPEAMVTALSVLSELEKLRIEFEFPEYLLDHKSLPLPTRALLPALTKFQFEGISRYLEGLVASIDAPLLNYLRMTFDLHDIFDTPQLTQFIGRTPNLKTHKKAYLVFSDYEILVTFPQTFDGALKLRISCGQLLDAQLSSLAEVFGSSFFPQAFIHAVEHLYIFGDLWQQKGVGSSRWLELFHPFTTVKGLHITQGFAPRIAPALQELTGERSTDVLPALQTIFLEDPLSSGLVLDDTGRLSGYPISVSRWGREEYEFTYGSDDDIDCV